jgi:hypothetical protein
MFGVGGVGGNEDNEPTSPFSLVRGNSCTSYNITYHHTLVHEAVPEEQT